MSAELLDMDFNSKAIIPKQYDVKMSKPKKYGWPRNRVTYVCAAKLSIILSNNPKFQIKSTIHLELQLCVTPIAATKWPN